MASRFTVHKGIGILFSRPIPPPLPDLWGGGLRSMCGVAKNNPCGWAKFRLRFYQTTSLLLALNFLRVGITSYVEKCKLREKVRSLRDQNYIAEGLPPPID